MAHNGTPVETAEVTTHIQGAAINRQLQGPHRRVRIRIPGLKCTAVTVQRSEVTARLAVDGGEIPTGIYPATPQRQTEHRVISYRLPTGIDRQIAVDVRQISARQAAHSGKQAADIPASGAIRQHGMDHPIHRREGEQRLITGRIERIGIDPDPPTGCGPHIVEIAAQIEGGTIAHVVEIPADI